MAGAELGQPASHASEASLPFSLPFLVRLWPNQGRPGSVLRSGRIRRHNDRGRGSPRFSPFPPSYSHGAGQAQGGG